MSKKTFTPEQIISSLTVCADVDATCDGCVINDSLADSSCCDLRRAALDLIVSQAKRIAELEEEAGA